jgi:hypothetical protein
MSLLPDHMLCPALAGWLPRLLQGARPARFVAAEWSPPRRLRKLVAELPELGEVEACDVAVVLTPLLPVVPDAVVRGVEPGGRVIEIGVPMVGSALSVLTPWRRRRVAAVQAAERFGRWVERGLTEAEQWVSIDPADTVVTIGVVSR